jgi:hypothetical protein
MSRILKSLHLAALSLGFLGAVAAAFNLIIFSILFPQVTQLLESQPNWETYGVVAAINIIVIAFYQLFSVLALLIHLIVRRQTSGLVVAAITVGIISGLMVLGDITLLSDIGNEYEAGLQTRGEWMILFASYGLHLLSLVLGIVALIGNLKGDTQTTEQPIKDEVLFLSLHSTGVICGILGLAGVIVGIFSGLETWMLQMVVGITSLLIVAPYLIILIIWLFRRFWGLPSPDLDEKQYLDLTRAGLTTLLIALPVMAIYYRVQITQGGGIFSVLWFPLLLFMSMSLFSSLALRAYRYN